jgi:hypothetical protein
MHFYGDGWPPKPKNDMILDPKFYFYKPSIVSCKFSNRFDSAYPFKSCFPIFILKNFVMTLNKKKPQKVISK